MVPHLTQEATLATESVEHGISGPLLDPGSGLDEPEPPGPAPEQVCVPDPADAASGRAPEYPGATRFVAANPVNYLQWTGCDPRPIERIVIHITDGNRRIDGPIGHFQDPKSQVSAHYLVGQDGQVVQMVRHDDIAWHAHTANETSIGIEHVARSPRELQPNDPGLPLTRAQYRASAALSRWLCQHYGLPLDRDHIQGHSEADPTTTHKDCPNRIWNWPVYMALVNGSGAY